MVVIIIGILAAIAIPVMLAQRNAAREAAAESDLRNGAAATACASANGGSFATCDEATLTGTYDWNQTVGVNSEVTTNTAGRWVARAQHNDGGGAFEFDSNTGRLTPLAARF
jgi:type II secretory pathway pseudopilin PulG